MLPHRNPEEIRPYLTDASNLQGGSAEAVYFPENENQVVEIIREANAKQIPLTVAGNGTGLAGARVPFGGWVMATERLNHIQEIRRNTSGQTVLLTGPGVLLKDLQQYALSQKYFYPAIPTSILSFIGGNIATNASGPQSFKYGAARRYVERLRLVTAEGDILDLRRGQIRAKDGVIEIPFAKGSVKSSLRVPVPRYVMPKIKHAGGYYAAAEMDAVDLFIGTEGTLGVFTEVELKVLPLPPIIFSAIIFFPSEEDAWSFSSEAARVSLSNSSSQNDTALSARAMEYMDAASLNLIRAQYPDIPRDARAAIYLEQECQPQTEQMLTEQYHILFERHHALVEPSWFSSDAEGYDKFRRFRHDIPLQVRDFLRRHGQKKIGTDFAVPRERFTALMLYQRQRLEELKLRSVTFGHIGDAHVHLNILPQNEDEHRKGWALYQELVALVLEMKGSVAAEHGIGKIKVPFLVQMMGEKAVAEMAELKSLFDPRGILGRGTLLSESRLTAFKPGHGKS